MTNRTQLTLAQAALMLIALGIPAFSSATELSEVIQRANQETKSSHLTELYRAVLCIKDNSKCPSDSAQKHYYARLVFESAHSEANSNDNDFNDRVAARNLCNEALIFDAQVTIDDLDSRW